MITNMRGINTTEKIILTIKELRAGGHTLSEIKKLLNVPKTTVYKYIKNVEIKDENRDDFAKKRIGSRYSSLKKWSAARKKADQIMNPVKSLLDPIVLACLYWGEGNKKELSLINSDPGLVKIFIDCLFSIGVEMKDLKITLRVYEDKNIQKIKDFWANYLHVPLSLINNVNILVGKKDGKLKFGMCRIRVKKGGAYFKLIMSMIDFLRLHYQAAVVQWIAQDTAHV